MNIKPNQASDAATPAGSGTKVLVIGAFGVLVLLALAVPFVYETQTLWYKTGLNKIMLRAGQMAGLVALVLLFVQILLALRLHQLEAIFGASRLVRWHQVNGGLIALAALAHVLLILAPEGLTNLPLGKKYWPEMVGGGLLAVILLTVIWSKLRLRFKLDFKRWRTVHKPLGYLALFLVAIHVLFVSESFRQGVPRIGLLVLFLSLVALTIAVKWLRRRARANKAV